MFLYCFIRICICLIDITMELRGLKVGWTLHCWMHSLATAHEMRLDSVIDQLLQDFLQVCPDDYSTQFVQECLPLLFNIFRYSKVSPFISVVVYLFCISYYVCSLYRRKGQRFFLLISFVRVSGGNQ